jgi:hypothetical protein
MSIDARIASVRHTPTKHILKLAPRERGGIAGQRTLHITRNPDYVPHAGDEIWGNASQCMVGPHEFRRIMQLWDGTEKVL